MKRLYTRIAAGAKFLLEMKDLKRIGSSARKPDLREVTFKI
jgi:hypothetical protein